MRVFTIAILALSLGCKRAPVQAQVADAPASQKSTLQLTGGKKAVTVCVDAAESYPFSFVQDGEFKGVHVDVAREAIHAAGFAVTFKFLPWKRCIEHEMKNGASDAALSAAWNETREAFLWYPDTARALGPKCKSPEALICNGPILLAPFDSTFTYAGDPKQIPEPIRATFGYVQAQTFRELGKKVDEGPGDEFNVGKMIRDGTGSVLIWLLNLPRIEHDPRFEGKFRVVDGFQDLSDGFLPFSKEGVLTQAEARKVWQELKRLRSNPDYLDNVIARYPPTSDGKP